METLIQNCQQFAFVKCNNLNWNVWNSNTRLIHNTNRFVWLYFMLLKNFLFLTIHIDFSHTSFIVVNNKRNLNMAKQMQGEQVCDQLDLVQFWDSDRAFFINIAGDPDIGSIKSLHTLFVKHLDHILVNFEQNRMFRTIESFELFDKKVVNYFWQSIDAILENVFVTKETVWCHTINSFIVKICTKHCNLDQS